MQVYGHVNTFSKQANQKHMIKIFNKQISPEHAFYNAVGEGAHCHARH